jgi:hypothetical protein
MEQRQSVNKKFVGIWMDAELAAKLYAKARRLDRSAASMIRKLLRDELGDENEATQ